jgi:hypothetical protein
VYGVAAVQGEDADVLEVLHERALKIVGVELANMEWIPRLHARIEAKKGVGCRENHDALGCEYPLHLTHERVVLDEMFDELKAGDNPEAVVLEGNLHTVNRLKCDVRARVPILGQFDSALGDVNANYGLGMGGKYVAPVAAIASEIEHGFSIRHSARMQISRAVHQMQDVLVGRLEPVFICEFVLLGLESDHFFV